MSNERWDIPCPTALLLSVAQEYRSLEPRYVLMAGMSSYVDLGNCCAP
jgi:hypothetical protein